MVHAMFYVGLSTARSSKRIDEALSVSRVKTTQQSHGGHMVLVLRLEIICQHAL